MFRTVLLLTTIVALSCNSSKNLNSQVHKRDADGRDVKIKYPQQQTATPQNINMSYDFEQLFTAAQNKQIDSLVRVFEKSNLISIKVVTLPADNITSGSLENNNKNLLKEWEGVHGNTDKALVVSISKGLNKAAIDYGPFVGKLLSRSEADQIIRNQLLPGLQSGNVFGSTWKGLNDLMDTIRRNIK
ncbi:YgcG family protein [Niabella sp.]|uniref:TPM domain-containing protein n=1 Tax=Niabella sp. TaxID=1962976 RepID=UPI00263293B0|nr:TPM domain-containing protein [Niabella sp.]